MRKILTLLTVLMLGILTAHAQERSVSGKVTDSTGNPVPFATVKVVGSRSGQIADNAGNFIIKAKAGDAIEISSTGYATQTISVGNSDTYNVTMRQGASNTLAEVVVTGAYNTKATSRSVSYNAQVVTSENLNVTRQTNLNSALVGKVSGIQFRGQSALKLGNPGAVQLRGASGLGTGEGIIYVVDGTILPNINDINLDDIENVTVLQGPAAAAQFGSQGANGAIVITLKKGSKNAKGIGVDVNIGVQADKVYILPNYQNAYSGGSSQDMLKYTWTEDQPQEWKALDGKYYHNYDDDASWGPRMVGQEYIPWYAWYGGTQYSYKTASLVPQSSNARDFYETGLTYNNSVAVSKATDQSSMRFSYGNISINGVLPNSSLGKNTFNLSVSHNINEHLTVSANINYVAQLRKGVIDEDGYANQSAGSFNQWFHRDLDMGIVRELKDLTTDGGIYASWNHNNPTSYSAGNPLGFYGGNYWYNFFTYFDKINETLRTDRIFGDISLNYKIINGLSVKATYRKHQLTSWNEQTTSSDLQRSATQTGVKGSYYTYESFSNREDYEMLATYSNKFFDKLQVTVNAGSDFFRLYSKDNGAYTNNGLTIPNYFSITNSVDQPTVLNYRSAQAYNAVFGIANIGYKNLVFVNATLRNDRFSTLPVANRDVLSKSFGASFVFSDLLKMPALSFGKIRASWGEIPQALGVPGTNPFGAYVYPGFSYGVGSNQFNGNIVTSVPDRLVDPNISGAVKTQKEVGIDLKFLKNRIGLAVTYWDGSQTNFPIDLTTNGTSGYTSYYTNGGKIAQRGLDLQFNARPFVSPNFEWELNATWSRLIKNSIVSLDNGQIDVQRKRVEATSFSGNTPNVWQIEGMRWGQLFGNGIKRIDGKPVLTDAGLYVSDPNTYFGSVLPMYTGGMQNTFNVLKDFVVRVNVDYQYGGKFFSLSNMWGAYSGLTARTATYNDKGNPIRDPVADGGGKHVVGVDADGKDVDYYVDAQTYYHGLYSNKTMDEFVYDLSFVKLREISIGYNLPVNKMGGLSKIVNRAVFSLVANNPVLIYAQTKDFDPSELTNVGSENGQFPGTRGFGFNLKVGF